MSRMKMITMSWFWCDSTPYYKHDDSRWSVDIVALFVTTPGYRPIHTFSSMKVKR